MGLYLLHNDICANGDDVIAFIGGQGGAEHLASQSKCCITLTPAQRVRTHSIRVPIHLDELKDGKIGFEATALSYSLEACPSDGPLKSSESRLEMEKHLDKIQL